VVLVSNREAWYLWAPAGQTEEKKELRVEKSGTKRALRRFLRILIKIFWETLGDLIAILSLSAMPRKYECQGLVERAPTFRRRFAELWAAEQNRQMIEIRLPNPGGGPTAMPLRTGIVPGGD
jgi:hypothetical protein